MYVCMSLLTIKPTTPSSIMSCVCFDIIVINIIIINIIIIINYNNNRCVRWCTYWQTTSAIGIA